MTAASVVGVAVAGAIGAPARYLLDGYVRGRTEGAFPWGTFWVNATGSLLLGVITGAGLYHAFSGTPRIVLGTGFCGAFTTFSTFAHDTVSLAADEAPRLAWANALASVAVGCGAAALGLALAAAA